jgi:hypothetical protein
MPVLPICQMFLLDTSEKLNKMSDIVLTKYGNLKIHPKLINKMSDIFPMNEMTIPRLAGFFVPVTFVAVVQIYLFSQCYLYLLTTSSLSFVVL